MDYCVYILFSEILKRYYVGSTKDLKDRLERHNTGRSKYTSKGMPWQLVKTFPCSNRTEAVQLERRIKARGAKRFLEDERL